MATHHFLGALPKIGETLWYVAHRRGEWLALLGAGAEVRRARPLDRLGLPRSSTTASTCSRTTEGS